MKSLIRLSLLFFTINSYSSDLSWVDEQVKAIKPARLGIDNSNISKVKDPFIFLEKNGYKKKKVVIKKVTKKVTKKVEKVKVVKKVGADINLDMVINVSALINGTWYKAGDNVLGYTLISVGRDSATLTFDGKTKKLRIKSKKSNLKFERK